MNILETAKKQFSNIARIKIDVPEWETEIYCRGISIEEMSAVQNSGEAYYDRVIATVIVKAEDAEGKKIFKKADAYDLKNKVDAKIISRIYEEISNIPSINRQKKESKKTKT
ncbi:hypothetical protein MJH12_15280 [bacterium]|nr:hypothetical protein [bacterium]